MGSPLDVSARRSSRKSGSAQISDASVVPDASKASVGLPSISRVKTKDTGGDNQMILLDHSLL
jgi:hypothetical protein